MDRLIFTTLALSVAALASCSKPAAPPAPPASAGLPPALPLTAQAIADNNRGVGVMGKFDYDAAHDVFEKLVQANPGWLDAQVNLGIAKLNRRKQGAGDEEAALDIFAQVLAADPQHLRAQYCTGILLHHNAKIAEALERFRAVSSADPQDAYAAYWTGRCLFDQSKYAESVEWFEKARHLDGSLRSAPYSLSQVYRRVGRVDEANKMLEEFQQLEKNPQSRVWDIKYTRMGPKGDALAVSIDAPAAKRPEGPVFGPPKPLPISGADGAVWMDGPVVDEVPPTTTACDIDGDGQVDLFQAAALMADGARRNAVLLRRGEKFALDRAHPLAAVTDVRAALWGDFDNDGLTDVYFCRRGPNQLWRQSSRGNWADVTAATKAAGAVGNSVAGRFYDTDHDGDLDLLLVHADQTDEILSNNRDGTFRALGRGGVRRALRQVLLADLDHDRDLDIIVLHDPPPHEVIINQRLWNFQAAAGTDEFRKAEIAALVAADVDANGQLELYGLTKSGLVRWELQPNANSRPDFEWRQTGATSLEMPPDARGLRSLTVADVDGDGMLEFVAAIGDQAWVVAPTTIDWKTVAKQQIKAAVGGALVALDVARGPSWVAFVPGKGPIVCEPSENRYSFAALSFSGKEEKSQDMRSNASGIGTMAAVRVGSRWTALHPLAASSSSGQSLQPLAVGLGGAATIDFISLTWPDGVFQTELALDSGKLHAITETQRQASSCPVLFVWDGTKYVFVTDLLGVGGLGFNLGKGQYAPPRPWENVLLPAGVLQPRDGRMHIKLGEPMEEVCYLDSAKLVAYDLPPGWHMTLDERFGESPPEPTGRPLFFRREWLPTRAVNDRGHDVTAAVATADRQAAEPGERDHRFIGRTREHTLTLRFYASLDHLFRVAGAESAKPRSAGDESRVAASDTESRRGFADSAPATPSGQLALVLDGWIEYPYSQTMFAAWQANAEYQSATLEARGADGKWHAVLPRFGYPAGMPRQMALPLPLDNLPADTRELRLRTNMEIYWDRAC